MSTGNRPKLNPRPTVTRPAISAERQKAQREIALRAFASPAEATEATHENFRDVEAAAYAAMATVPGRYFGTGAMRAKASREAHLAERGLGAEQPALNNLTRDDRAVDALAKMTPEKRADLRRWLDAADFAAYPDPAPDDGQTYDPDAAAEYVAEYEAREAEDAAELASWDADGDEGAE